jgi:peroxiredoxin
MPRWKRFALATCLVANFIQSHKDNYMNLLKKRRNRKYTNTNLAGSTTLTLLPGTPAPEFILESTAGRPLSLEDFRGQPLILAFYPADQSPVCSNQLALYNEALPMFEEFDARLVGISVDDMDSHRSFAQNLRLSFPLLADNDPQGQVARDYGVFDEDGGVSDRALFVIDPEGIIRWRYISPKGVNPGADGILTALEALND